jgi:putative DNA primase/helicase
VIFPDNDDAGQKYANAVALSACEYACSVKVVQLPGLPDKGDVSDFLQTKTAAEILAIAQETSPWTPPPLLQVLKAAEDNHPKITRLSEVGACAVEWVWEPYLASGMLALVSGDPGAGKTFVALRIAADITLGRTPFKHTPRPAANVLYLTVENSPEHVLRPRFDLLGGDPTRFHLIDGSVRLSEISYLSGVLQQTQAELMVVDPVQSFLGAQIDTHRANETRPLLDNLARLGKVHKCGIMLLRHLSKEPKGRAIHRGLGSVDFTGAVRTELLVGSSSSNPQQRAVVHIKSNLGQMGPTLGFAINENGFDWTGESELTAKDLLQPEAPAEKGEAMAEAKEFLLTALSKGPRPANEVFAEGDQAGISKATLKRAKKALSISKKKVGQTGPWVWALPEGDHTPETQKP